MDLSSVVLEANSTWSPAYTPLEKSYLHSVKNQGRVLDIPKDHVEKYKGLHPEVIKLLYEAQQPNGSYVPKLVHFIHGLKKEGEVKFTMIHYLAVKAAHDFIQPDAIYLHYITYPSGEWWEKARSYLILRQVRTVNTVFGNPVVHFAHKADVLRLEILLTYGGIYLDIDVIALKSFDELLRYDMTLGEEARTEANGPHGLGNGVIIAKRDSVFLREWYRAYKQFDHTKWAQLSIHFPLKLHLARPGLVHVLPRDAFYTPCWDSKGAKLLYESNAYDLSNNYAVHVWASEKQRINSVLEVCQLSNTFGRILRIALMAHGNEKACPGANNLPTPEMQAPAS